MFTTGDPRNFSKLKFLDDYLTGHNGFIAGGVFKNIFMNEKIKDIDIFFRNESDFEEANRFFSSGVEPVYDNDRVMAYEYQGVRVELIKHIFGSPEEILKQFDFTVTKFAYGFKIDPSVETLDTVPFVTYHDDFFEHLLLKRLVIDQELKWPISTFERSYRYASYGFNLCRESKIVLLESIISRGAVEAHELALSLYAGID